MTSSARFLAHNFSAFSLCFPGNFVTSSQAQRKWVSKIISKVSSGAYQIGANSANIIVQDRASGQLQEEKMASYVRFGIRVLYKGARSRMEGSRGQSKSSRSRIRVFMPVD